MLKSDNDGAFDTPGSRTLLCEHGVHPLKSPPYTPWYNGAIEASQGELKRHAAHHAHRQGNGDHWTDPGIRWAVYAANLLCNPAHAGSASAQELRASRDHIGRDERLSFTAWYEHIRDKYQALLNEPPSKSELAMAERQAMATMCIKYSYLRMCTQ